MPNLNFNLNLKEYFKSKLKMDSRKTIDFSVQLLACLLLANIGSLAVDRLVYISDEVLHLSVVACGDRLEETLMMIKSSCLFSQNPMHYHIFADDELRPLFTKQLNMWPDFITQKFEFSVYPITYPEGEDAVNWKKVFKPCATQRLFIPYALGKYAPEVKRLIYVDTDILFFRPLEDLWAFFEEFNATHIAALTPEHEAPWMGWYNRFARHPYYGEMGVNSGVMLMNVQDIRESNWLQYMISAYQKYRYNITWGDQDLINIFFNEYPEKLYVFECHWNYRPDHCMYGSVCKQADQHGVQVVHGNRGYYHNDKQPAFKAIYQALKNYKFGQDMKEHLLVPMTTDMADTKHTYCGKVSNILVMELQRQVIKVRNREMMREAEERDRNLNKHDSQKQNAEPESISTPEEPDFKKIDPEAENKIKIEL